MIKNGIFNYETFVHATAGAAGGIFAMSVIYPLDTIKFRVQLEDNNLLGKSTVEALIYILKNEGFESLYKGIRPVLASLGVSNFLFFYSFRGLKALHIPGQGGTVQNDLLLSTLAGVLNVFITCPLWVVNSRLKASSELRYSGLLDGVLHIANTEGLGALWASLGPSLLLVSNPAIHSTVYELLKRHIRGNTALHFFLLAALAKAISTVATYPLQVVQTKQRSSKEANINTATLLLSILKKNGPGALYNGLEAKLLQTIFTTGLMYMTYEKIARFIFKILVRNRKNLS